MSSTSAPGAVASISRMLSVTSITANLSPKDYALTNFLALQFFHIMIAASCTEIILERLKLGFSNLRDTNRQFSAFARPVYCFVLLFWTLVCARSSRRFNDITKHRKSSSNQASKRDLVAGNGSKYSPLPAADFAYCPP
jgi:hypothetical protein